MSPQQQSIISALVSIHRDTRVPVTTISITFRVYMSPASVRRYLVRLEEHGLICRVGQRGGWLPKAA